MKLKQFDISQKISIHLDFCVYYLSVHFSKQKRLNPGRWKYSATEQQLIFVFPKATKADMENYQAMIGEPGFNLSTPTRVDLEKKVVIFSNCKRINLGGMIFDHTKN